MKTLVENRLAIASTSPVPMDGQLLGNVHGEAATAAAAAWYEWEEQVDTYQKEANWMSKGGGKSCGGKGKGCSPELGQHSAL